MPHLPVTAVTRVSEKFSGETISSTGATAVSAGLLGQSKNKNGMAIKTSNQAGKRDKNNLFAETGAVGWPCDPVVTVKPCFCGCVSRGGTLI